jgi:hypothetical protein
MTSHVASVSPPRKFDYSMPFNPLLPQDSSVEPSVESSPARPPLSQTASSLQQRVSDSEEAVRRRLRWLEAKKVSHAQELASTEDAIAELKGYVLLSCSLFYGVL